VRYLDRHSVYQLVRYGEASSLDSDTRSESADEIEEWLSIQFDAAVQAGRDLFLSTVKASPLEWPWSAVTPVAVDWGVAGDDLAGSIREAPPALVLLVLRSVDNPELLGPESYLDDEDAAGPLRGALEDWSPSALKSLAGEAGWSSELPTPEGQGEPNHGEDGPPPTDPTPVEPAQPAGHPAGQPADLPADHPADQPEHPSPVEEGSGPPRAWWQRWETWAAVGVTTAAVIGTAAYYRRRE